MIFSVVIVAPLLLGISDNQVKGCCRNDHTLLTRNVTKLIRSLLMLILGTNILEIVSSYKGFPKFSPSTYMVVTTHS